MCEYDTFLMYLYVCVCVCARAFVWMGVDRCGLPIPFDSID